jgi:hypothetical protein
MKSGRGLQPAPAHDDAPRVAAGGRVQLSALALHTGCRVLGNNFEERRETTTCRTAQMSQEVSMATHLLRAAGDEQCRPRQGQQRTEHQPLRMNWVVVTDENGNRRLRMYWRVDWNVWDQFACSNSRVIVLG